MNYMANNDVESFVKRGVAWVLLWLTPFALSWMGCAGPTPVSPAVVAPISFDELLSKPDVRERMREVERDLPDDVWKAGGESHPVIRNVSRSEREAELAYQLLTSIQPRIKQLTPEALVDSLKTESAMAADAVSGVADLVYAGGNLAIIKELNSRPMSELKRLRDQQSDGRIVYTGNAGGQTTVGGLVRSALMDQPP